MTRQRGGREKYRERERIERDDHDDMCQDNGYGERVRETSERDE